MVISNVDVYGLKRALKTAKYPKAVDVTKVDDLVQPFHAKLGSADIGSGHDNYLNGIIVQFDLCYTIKAWMHKIHQMSIADNCIEYVSPKIIEEVERLKEEYNKVPTQDNFLKLIYSVPVGFQLTAGMTTNYRQLKTIYYQRRNHRLPEWREFCKWIETLPMFKELVLNGDNKNE